MVAEVEYEVRSVGIFAQNGTDEPDTDDEPLELGDPQEDEDEDDDVDPLEQ